MSCASAGRFDRRTQTSYDESRKKIEPQIMDTLPVKPERMEALKKYAHQLGKDPAEVLDDALSKFLDYETWFARAVEE